jgi:hypothetical protein
MKCDGYQSRFQLRNAPYNLTLATEASSSTASVWSDSSSQHSDDSSSSTSSASDSCDSYCFSQPSSQSSVSSVESACGPNVSQDECLVESQTKQCLDACRGELPRELRQNPRRSFSVNTRTGRPPTLVRQAERKHSFVDNLVDSATHIIEAIWPLSSTAARNEENEVLPLRTFIQETLRRSRTSYSTLQVALYYLILIKPHVPDHDFTMEQPNDFPATQAIQCGRRMFLAALILASKYLQDRNYSARAWSKISGLLTHEINQNEMAFLLAVNWKLHITEEIYNRWCECVTKFRPPQPPSPSALSVYELAAYERQCEEFRDVISTLNPELDNLEVLDKLSPVMPPQMIPRDVFSRDPLYTPRTERTCAFSYDGEITPTKLPYGGVPAVMEPLPTAVYTLGRLPAPALGLLPTPKLTPQSSGYSTPAVSAASHLLSRGSMVFAMAHASSAAAAQSLDRWPPSALPSPQTHFMRRSSLATSVSTASSPESMVSDSSRYSRSSSISSASSVGAPSTKLDALARYRSAKLCSERSSLRPTFAPVPEDHQVECLVASPESYTGPVGDPYGRGYREEMREAARALQELQTHGASKPAPVQILAGSKRRRTASVDNSLQDDVRELLSGQTRGGESMWSDALLRANVMQMPVRTDPVGSNKRLCCSTESTQPFIISSLHPAVGGVGGPGMWSGILQ